LEEDIYDVMKYAFGEHDVLLYYEKGKYLNLNDKAINHQRALWLNKEWAVKRRIQIHQQKMEEEKEKADKKFSKKITTAVHNSIENDPDKQPVIKPYRVEDYSDHVFCCANSCTKRRTIVPVGVDDGWRKCCVSSCTYWLCNSGNCQKQIVTHIRSCLFKKTYCEQKPFST
jgi:hypothetical protein